MKGEEASCVKLLNIQNLRYHQWKGFAGFGHIKSKHYVFLLSCSILRTKYFGRPVVASVSLIQHQIKYPTLGDGCQEETRRNTFLGVPCTGWKCLFSSRALMGTPFFFPQRLNRLSLSIPNLEAIGRPT